MFKRLLKLSSSQLLLLGIGTLLPLMASPPLSAQEEAPSSDNAVAYATPYNDFVWKYPFYTTYQKTLFRSERFDPLMETDEGFIVTMPLGGETKLVLLPFNNGERKVAERKFDKSIGVTYTAYVDFTEGSVPFFKGQYYPVASQTPDTVTIDYQIHDYHKSLEIPRDRLLVKTAFQHELETKLAELRKSYLSKEFTLEAPASWEPIEKIVGINPAPGQLAFVESPAFATDSTSSQNIDFADLADPIMESKIRDRALKIIPVLFSIEANDEVYNFIRIKGQQRPALIRDITAAPEQDSYYKYVRIKLPNGQDARLLEITDGHSIEVVRNTHFFKKGDLLPSSHASGKNTILADNAAFEVIAGEVSYYTPENFIRNWETLLESRTLAPGKTLWNAFVSTNITGSKFDFNWESLQALQAVSRIWTEYLDLNQKGLLAEQVKTLRTLENCAETYGIQLDKLINPNLDPVVATVYRKYWKDAYRRAFYSASKQNDYNTLNRLLVKARMLTEELQNQTLVNFLSEQVYTYVGLIPKPLGPITTIELSPPLEASPLALFDLNPKDAFKQAPPKPITSLKQLRAQEAQRYFYYVKPDISDKAIAPVSAWYKDLHKHLLKVSNPAYWQTPGTEQQPTSSDTAAPEQNAENTASSGLQDQPQNSVILSPWLAVLGWLIMLTLVNGGFFIISKLRPATVLSSPA